ncbi:RNA-directed DNA polymerase from mobile element jockey [Trichonephila clavipes]|nr:RNA-directed DNA polymerase from mobile element jockey [Trichonephila clavipes]
MNETTQQEKTTQLSSRNEQLNSAAGTKQLNSSVGTKQLNSEMPSAACNRLHRLYSRIGFFYLLTLHQLIRVTNIINDGFANKFYTVGVFLDVKRAFDKMWHDGLTYKLIKLKFPGYLIKIIHNYLHNRTFRVRVNNTFSTNGLIQSGTPQGSSLSPSLYNIYTHDFPEHPTVSTCLFADDFAMLTQGTQLKYTLKNMQNYLDKLQDWLTQWRIATNVDKSQAIIFRKWGVIDPPFSTHSF